MFRTLRAGVLIGLVTLVACASPSADPTAPLSVETGAVSISPVPLRFTLKDGGELQFLSLAPTSWGLSQAPRHRVYAVPGSGCNGLANIALDYFRGLRHGEVIVPHKRHVDASRWQGTGARCTPAFEREDNLAGWSEDAAAFIVWHMKEYPPRADQPVVLMGISEGAELLTVLARQVPQARILILVGSSGLDPFEALGIQAHKIGAPTFVDQLLQRTSDTRFADDYQWAGRSLGYWRRLVAWRYSQALLETPQFLWLGFGGQDDAVPLAALRRFESIASERKRSVCLVVFDDADHGLQARGSDAPLQFFWSLVADAVERSDSMKACPTWARR